MYRDSVFENLTCYIRYEINIILSNMMCKVLCNAVCTLLCALNFIQIYSMSIGSTIGMYLYPISILKYRESG